VGKTDPVNEGLPKGLRKKNGRKGSEGGEVEGTKRGARKKNGGNGGHLLNNESRMLDGGSDTAGPSTLDHRHHHRRAAQTTGIVKNLVIPLKWRDHTRRILPSREDIDVLMNHKGPEARCPTGSVRDVFLENSYEQLELISTVVDWIVVPKSEAFYADKVSG
jgi:hypothetical protein